MNKIVNMQADPVIKFKHYFENLDTANTDLLHEFYDKDIKFMDPIHQIKGLQELTTYFKRLNKNLKSGRFTFTDEIYSEGKLVLMWEMKLMLKRPRKQINVSGVSVLYYTDKITLHQDFFDAGALFYEHIPILGFLIRKIKQKIAQ